MAVELAKVGLWLHTLTAGAPLSFLDHHLRCGDSLFGEKVKDVREFAGKKGARFLTSPLMQAEGAVQYLAKIERLTDADMDEAKESAAYFDSVREATEPLFGFFSFVHALSWVDPTAEERKAVTALLDGLFGTDKEIFEIASGRREPRAPLKFRLSKEQVLQMSDEAILAAHTDTPDQKFLARYVSLVRLLDRTQRLISDERFLHWELAFPGVWSDWSSAEPRGGFDAIVGNPPWDRMKMQEVEWFEARKPDIAKKSRAADRKKAIEALTSAGDPLADQYALARNRAARGAKLATKKGGPYPWLGRGDVNIYSLFVERSLQLIRPAGLSGLLVPSGIASDKTASKFFKSISTAGRIRVLFDFENKRSSGTLFFDDIHRQFKFSALVIGGEKRTKQEAQVGFFLRETPQEEETEKLFSLSANDFALVNPNTGTAPIFRTRRDAQLTTSVYHRLPVLVDRSGDEPHAAWDVRYVRMFDMTNDSEKFWTYKALEAEGAYPESGGRWRKGERIWLPLLEGKMIWHFDHRAASIAINPENTYRAAYAIAAQESDKKNPFFATNSQFFIEVEAIYEAGMQHYALGFRDVTNPTDHRTVDAAIVPHRFAGNTLPIIIAEKHCASTYSLLCANFNALCFDYISRQKVQKNHLNWYIVEQLPVVGRADYERRFGDKTAAEIVADHVLRLTYTAWDMEPFARDLGYEGDPFVWDETERRQLRARLDALYFHLYGVTDPDDVRYILSTFPIVERKDRTAFDGVYLTAELISWYMRALAAGDTEAVAPEAELIRQATARG